MSKEIEIEDLKDFAPRLAYVIKHRTADHQVRNGIYDNYDDAVQEMNTIPMRDLDGCGSRTEYEIVEVHMQPTRAPRKIKKIKVK